MYLKQRMNDLTDRFIRLNQEKNAQHFLSLNIKNHFIFLSHACYEKKNTFIYREEFLIRLNFQ